MLLKIFAPDGSARSAGAFLIDAYIMRSWT
jgi:hypothetical protein